MKYKYTALSIGDEVTLKAKILHLPDEHDNSYVLELDPFTEIIVPKSVFERQVS